MDAAAQFYQDPALGMYDVGSVRDVSRVGDQAPLLSRACDEMNGRILTFGAARQLTALVIASARDYHAPMSPRSLRQISALLMTLVLVIGLVTHGFGGPGVMLSSTMTLASDMSSSGGEPMQGKCNGCAGDEKGVAPAACSAFCSAVAALPAPDVGLFAVPAETLTPTAGPDAIGWTRPPDPYPPRMTILS